jgi:spermidine synthase
MNQPNLRAVAAYGRRWLLLQPPSAQWDMIAIDAYRPTNITYHLTTVEFFTQVREHLSASPSSAAQCRSISTR